jgi:hypothetical protein
VTPGGRRSYAGSEQGRELVGRDRAAEVVPLRFVTLVSLKKILLFDGFHAFRDDP